MASTIENIAVALQTKLGLLTEPPELAQLGVPVSSEKRTVVSVTLGQILPERRATQMMRYAITYWLLFVYRVDGKTTDFHEQAAEQWVMKSGLELVEQLYADQTLGGLVNSLSVESAGANEPEYTLRLGREYREYPMSVTVEIDGAYTL